MSELQNLIESKRSGLLYLNGLRIEQYGNGVLNVMDLDRTLTRERLDVFRRALAEAGYREKESWVAAQAVSWLSGGTFAGVSMKVVKS